MNNVVFGKTMENLKKHVDIKKNRESKQKECKKYLVSEPNYHTTRVLTQKLLVIETKKTKILMTKPVYLGLSMLELSKILMYEFWYD